jgi:hypothetical protein
MDKDWGVKLVGGTSRENAYVILDLGADLMDGTFNMGIPKTMKISLADQTATGIDGDYDALGIVDFQGPSWAIDGDEETYFAIRSDGPYRAAKEKWWKVTLPRGFRITDIVIYPFVDLGDSPDVAKYLDNLSVCLDDKFCCVNFHKFTAQEIPTKIGVFSTTSYPRYGPFKPLPCVVPENLYRDRIVTGSFLKIEKKNDDPDENLRLVFREVEFSGYYALPLPVVPSPVHELSRCHA